MVTSKWTSIKKAITLRTRERVTPSRQRELAQISSQTPWISAGHPEQILASRAVPKLEAIAKTLNNVASSNEN